MVNFIKRSSKRDNNSNKSQCKKHQKHKQSPGVCSLCLREKLSQISAYSSSSRTNTTSTPSNYSSSSDISSLSSYYSSASSVSSCSSPLHGYNHNVLQKSRSLAFLPTRIKRSKDNYNYEKKRSGFWSNLFFGSTSSNRNIEDTLMRSRTVRDQRVH